MKKEKKSKKTGSCKPKVNISSLKLLEMKKIGQETLEALLEMQEECRQKSRK